MENVVFSVAAVVPLVGGVLVGKRMGKLAGVLAGLALFAAVVLILVVAGYGY